MEAITPVNDVGDVSGLTITSFGSNFFLRWRSPIDRRLDYIEIKVDSNVSSGSLSEGSAVTCFQGNDENYIYNIPDPDVDKFHQFWVYSITRT